MPRTELALGDLLDRLDAAIRAGQTGSAASALSRWEHRRLPRAAKARFAQLCWRAGVAPLGLRALHPLVRPTERRPQKASPPERAEYAACLLRVGALEEAKQLLSTITPGDAPEALLYQAFAEVGTWDYAASLPLLRRYLEAEGVSAYQRLVGEVNLAAALVHERRSRQATTLLNRLVHQLSLRRNDLLLARCLELGAENLIDQRQLDRADAALERAATLLRSASGLDPFFVEKYRAVAAFLRHPSGKGARDLAAFRDRAVRLGHWESVRDCDRYEAVEKGDLATALKLYLGTPHASFRERLLADLKAPLTLPAEYRWELEAGRGPCLDLTQESSGSLKGGQLLHRLMLALTSDFYRPFRVASLHFRLYSDELFHPDSSPARVHEAVRRLRSWLKRHRLPLTVEEKGGSYRLAATSACSVRLPTETRSARRYGLRVDALQRHWPEAPFTLEQASKRLALPRRTALRALTEARSEGALESFRRANTVYYRFRRTG